MKKLFLLLSLILYISCSNSNDTNNKGTNSNNYQPYSSSGNQNSNDYNRQNNDNYNNDNSDDNDDNSDDDNSSSINGAGCGYENGIHDATVDYSNFNTNYTETYDLQVVVKDCQVIRIIFNNGGYI